MLEGSQYPFHFCFLRQAHTHAKTENTTMLKRTTTLNNNIYLLTMLQNISKVLGNVH